MPVEFLTDEQAASYGKFNEEPTRPELERFFFLDDEDRKLIAKRRGDHNRLGFAVQMCTVRYIGRFLPDDPLDVPWAVVEHLAAQTADVRTAYLEGRSIAALARDHGVSRGAIRTAVADLLPEHTASDPSVPAPELPVTLDMPGKVADYLRTTELEPAERVALDQGVAVRRGQGYTLRVSAVLAVHRQLLARCHPLDGGHGAPAVPAQRKARREYANRIAALGAPA